MRRVVMADKILEAFGERKRFNVPELALKLQVDMKRVRETLDSLVGLGKLRVEKKYRREDIVPTGTILSCRCSIRGPYGETYVLNE